MAVSAGFLKKFFKKIMILILMMCVAVSMCPPGVRADGGIAMNTSYPGMIIKPGDSAEFFLDIENNSEAPISADLSVTSIPQGWTSKFMTGSKQIHRVYVPVKENANTTKFSFDLKAPADAKAGDYMVALKADAGGGLSSTLELIVRLTTENTGEKSWNAPYPELQGIATATFDFSTTLVNNFSSDQFFSLTSQGPPGWTVSFKPTGLGNQVASLTVEPYKSQGISVSVKPPTNVEAGEYDIPVSAISAGEALNINLKVIITGHHELKLTTPDGLLSLDAFADKEKPVKLKVENIGNVDLGNVKITASGPPEWSNRFDVTSITLLKAGQSEEINAYITPAANAIAGDYVTVITASHASGATSSASFRIAVKTQTMWGFVAAGIVLVVLALLFGIFHKYGRR